MSTYYECTNNDCGWQGMSAPRGECPVCGAHVRKTTEALELEWERDHPETASDDGPPEPESEINDN